MNVIDEWKSVCMCMCLGEGVRDEGWGVGGMVGSE